MRAVVFKKSLPITDPEPSSTSSCRGPQPAGRDLLVKVEAVSVNPVDTKRRRGGDPPEGARARLGCGGNGGGRRTGGDAVQGAAKQCSTPARWSGPAPTPSTTWSTSASSAASRPG